MERQVSNRESTYCMPNRREGFPKGRETRPGDSTEGSSRRARPVTIGQSFSLGPEVPRSQGARTFPSAARAAHPPRRGTEPGPRSAPRQCRRLPPAARRRPNPVAGPTATEPGHGAWPRAPTTYPSGRESAELRRGSSGCRHCGHDGKAGEVPRDAR